MQNLYKKLNEIDVKASDYEVLELTDFEKLQIKARIKKKLLKSNKRKNFKTLGIAVAAVVICSVLFSNNSITLAKVPFFGSLLEDYLNLNTKKTFTDYKTIIGQTIEDRWGSIILNEVLLDEGRIVIIAHSIQTRILMRG